jgi:uridine kinase
VHELEGSIDGMRHVLSKLKPCIGLPLSNVATCLALIVSTQNRAVLAITGPSAVGKTTLADAIGRELGNLRITSEVICVDDFLREELHGGAKYRVESEVPISPVDFDFDQLEQAINALQNGLSLTGRGYVRGTGWVRDVRLRTADVFILEGMFLDSALAAEFLSYHLLVVLEAPWQLIADRRRQRDTRLRYRGALETEEIIASTRAEYLQYIREHERVRSIVINLDPRGLVKHVYAQEAPRGEP